MVKMKINLSKRLEHYKIKKLPDFPNLPYTPHKCFSCDSEYKYKAHGSCGYCYEHGYTDLYSDNLGNNACDLNNEIDEDYGCDRQHYNRERWDR